jgi:hypothetical protein
MYLAIPDLTNADNVRKIRNWEGDYNALNLFKMTVLRSAKAVKQDEEFKLRDQDRKKVVDYAKKGIVDNESPREKLVKLTGMDVDT